MANDVVIKLTGSLAPNDQISVRTLAHTMLSFQRAVDKIVMYETRGTLKKYDVLSVHHYDDADFLVQP